MSILMYAKKEKYPKLVNFYNNFWFYFVPRIKGVAMYDLFLNNSAYIFAVFFRPRYLLPLSYFDLTFDWTWHNINV